MDLSGKEGFLCKAKRIVSSLSEIILWASRLPSPMQIPKEYLLNQYRIEPAGLKNLIYPQGVKPLHNPGDNHPSFVINSPVLSSPSPLPSPSSTTTSSFFRSLSDCSSQSSQMDDLIGTESGVVYMNSEHEEEQMLELVNKAEAPSNRKRYQRGAVTREYPPPIPILVPRILTRHYDNGNLVLREERMQHHQYFEAYRENGRLLLRLVRLDDNSRWFDTVSETNEEIDEPELEFVKDEQEIEEEKLDEFQETEADYQDADNNFNNVEDETIIHKGSIIISASRMAKTCLQDEDEASRKCFTYSGRKVSDPNLFYNVDTLDPQQQQSVSFPVRRMTTVM